MEPIAILRHSIAKSLHKTNMSFSSLGSLLSLWSLRGICDVRSMLLPEQQSRMNSHPVWRVDWL